MKKAGTQLIKQTVDKNNLEKQNHFHNPRLT